MKRYYVRWSEDHDAVIVANSKTEAREKALSGEFMSDESAKLSSDVEISEAAND